ncbi:MAG: DUF6113 family protein [Leifsonia sp.]
MLTRTVNSVLLFLVGIIVGAVGTIAHQLSWSVGGFTLPWGLILALVAYAAMLVGLRLLSRSRVPTLVAALGSIAIILLFTQKSPGGSVLILNDLVGQIWLVAPFIIATLVLAWPDLGKQCEASTAAAGATGNRLS